MPKLVLFAVLVAGICLAGCGSGPAAADGDAVQYKTPPPSDAQAGQAAGAGENLRPGDDTK